jgi:hypothetical protein
MKIRQLVKKCGYEFSVKGCGIVRKRLDWRRGTAILALGSEEC